jgi:hypothetical protein
MAKIKFFRLGCAAGRCSANSNMSAIVFAGEMNRTADIEYLRRKVRHPQRRTIEAWSPFTLTDADPHERACFHKPGEG